MTVLNQIGEYGQVSALGNVKVYCNEGFVYISDRIVRFYATTHSLKHVNSVSISKISPNYLLLILIALVLIGFSSLFISFLLRSTISGLIIFIVGIFIALGLILFLAKPKYSIRLRMSSGEIDVIVTEDEDYANTIGRLLVQAIAENQ